MLVQNAVSLRKIRLFAGALMLAFFLLISSTKVLAAEWIYITDTSTGTEVFYDASSLRTLAPKFGREFQVVEVWIVEEHGRDNTKVEDNTRRMIRVDCAGKRIQIVTTTVYSKSGVVLESARDIDDYDFKYAPVVPGSIGEGIFWSVCRTG